MTYVIAFTGEGSKGANQKNLELLSDENKQSNRLGSSSLHDSARCHGLWTDEAELDLFFDWRPNRLPDRFLLAQNAGFAAFDSFADTCDNRDQVLVDALGIQE